MAAKQILFLQKNKADISNTVMTAAATEGNDYVLRALNGNNVTAWITTGSTDASNTMFSVNFYEPRRLTNIILANHNFKNYTLEWYNGSSWISLAAETNYLLSSSYYEFSLIHAEQLRMVIYGTQVANSDKYLYQFIASEGIGRLNAWPVIGNPKLDRNLQTSKMLSGKQQVTKNLGGWNFDLQMQVWTDSADLAVVQNLYSSTEGFLVSLCGGDDSQFRVAVEPYRLQDVLLMKTVGTYSPVLYKGLYQSGYNITMQLAEVAK